MKFRATLEILPDRGIAISLDNGYAVECRSDVSVRDIEFFLRRYGYDGNPKPPRETRPVIACPMDIGEDDDHTHD